MEGLFEQDAPPIVGYVQVALEQGIDVSATGLTYAVPKPMADLAVGERVRVPLGRGNKLVSGYVVERTDQPPVDPSGVKRVADRLGGLSLTKDLVELAKWTAGYYVCPLGMVFSAMLPAAVKHGTGSTIRTMIRPADAPPEDVKLTKLQQAIVDTLRDAGEPVEIRDLADRAGAKTTSPIRQLLDKGVFAADAVETVQSDLDLRARREELPGQVFTLIPAQQAAVDRLVAHLGRFGVHLLHGVTGSGKTEVYLRVIEAMRAEGTTGRRHEGTEGSEDNPHPSCLRPSVPPSRPSHPATIILVPEIALTPQTVGRFVQRFPDVAVLHSGLTAAQRHAQWRRIRRGEARVIVGARSAVFAPAPDLGLIIVDEEHESSYKQDQLPRYHARDLAIKRAQLLNIPVVLGSATPSLESYARCAGQGSGIRERGSDGDAPSDLIPDPRSLNPGRSHTHLLRIPQRVANQQLPRVLTVDLQEERRARKGIHLLSQALETALVATVDQGQQALLLLNRRGYANYIACPDHGCGWMLTCDHCDVTMVYHRDKTLPTGGVVRCHHCGAEQLLPTHCPESGHQVTVFGLGVQKVESELEQKLPRLTKRRMDSDTMNTARDYQETLDAFGRGEFQVLLGTQMIAKGLDFPNVSLVGVISADTSLHLPDFRAAERTFQLIAQVAGRAGRSDIAGQVIVQTFNPDDPTIALAAAHDYETFAQQELAVRQEVGLPPATRMARIVLRDRDPVAVTKRATQLAAALRQFNAHLGEKVTLRGPAPCAIARVADFHRHQIELLADAAGPLQQLLTAARNAKVLISDQHTAVDVDPISLL